MHQSNDQIATHRRNSPMAVLSRRARGAAFAALVILASARAWGDIYNVTTTDPTYDTVCDAHCSIEDAVRAASSHPGADEIILPAGVYAGTSSSGSVLPLLFDEDDITVTGAGIDATILEGSNGTGSTSVVEVETQDGNATISHLTIRNAEDFAVHAKVNGNGHITIDHSKLTGNFSGITTDSYFGLSDDPGAEILIADCTFVGNVGYSPIYISAPSDFFDVEIRNTVIQNNTGDDVPIEVVSGRVVITGSQIFGNSGGYGAILMYQGSLSVLDSVISGNSTYGGVISAGGGSQVAISRTLISDNVILGSGFYGIVEHTGEFDGSLTISESTIAGNQADLSAVWSKVPMSVRNSTISGNSACGLATNASSAVVNNCTIVNNAFGLCGDFVVGNTILANNYLYPVESLNCSGGSFISTGYNIDDGTSCTFAESGDISNVLNVGLAPLGNYGGPTPTHGLCTAVGIPDASCTGPSIALGAASPAIPGSGGGACEAIDQRGVTRPAGARCDIGAVEDQCQGPDSDGDGLCDLQDACTNIGGAQNITVKPKVLISRTNDAESGNDGLKLLGEFILPPGTSFGSLNPLANGARVVILNSGAIPILDIVIPAGAYGGNGTRGWALNAGATKWTFADGTASPINGIAKMLIQDRSGKAPNQVKVLIKGKDGSYPTVPADLPLSATVVLGGQASSEDGECGEVAFSQSECRQNGAQTKVTCKQ